MSPGNFSETQPFINSDPQKASEIHIFLKAIVHYGLLKNWFYEGPHL